MAKYLINFEANCLKKGQICHIWPRKGQPGNPDTQTHTSEGEREERERETLREREREVSRHFCSFCRTHKHCVRDLFKRLDNEKHVHFSLTLSLNLGKFSTKF